MTSCVSMRQVVHIIASGIVIEGSFGQPIGGGPDAVVTGKELRTRRIGNRPRVEVRYHPTTDNSKTECHDDRSVKAKRGEKGPL